MSGGCGCKIEPKVLKKLLTPIKHLEDKRLKVDFRTADDAAVYEISKNRYIVSTTDFFVPIVDNPMDFGKIAAANAISDIYAMGAKPLFALSILGIPKKNIKLEQIKKILSGASTKCNEAGINILGGHTIEIGEPIFGLAVTGETNKKKIITNCGAKYGDQIILTKPLGVGIYSAAFKKQKLNTKSYGEFIKITTLLNRPGYELTNLISIHAMTDVTGFGLLGHLYEICKASNVQINIYEKLIPVMNHAEKFLKDNIFTGASQRNFEFVKNKVFFRSNHTDRLKNLLCDPQTSGGLLIFISKKYSKIALEYLHKNGFSKATIIGEVEEKKSTLNVL